MLGSLEVAREQRQCDIPPLRCRTSLHLGGGWWWAGRHFPDALAPSFAQPPAQNSSGIQVDVWLPSPVETFLITASAFQKETG